MREIEQVLDFIVEIERLKSVTRKSKPVGIDRYENSAEHSWHVCLSALVLKDFSNEKINISRVVMMLLIHDLGEIDTGDIIIYESENPELKRQEAKGVERILNILPDGMKDIYLPLWYEFEDGKTDDAKFAKSIDRVPPLLHNLFGEGHTWEKNSITKEEVFNLNKRIDKGSNQLWAVIKNKLDMAVRQGILK